MSVIHRGPYIQRGRGLGNIFASFFRAVLPAMKNVGKSVLKSSLTKDVLKTAREGALNAGINLMADTITGDNVVDNLKRNVAITRQEVGNKVRTYANKNNRSKIGVKKKRNSVNTNRSRLAKRARKINDIFDS